MMENGEEILEAAPAKRPYKKQKPGQKKMDIGTRLMKLTTAYLLGQWFTAKVVNGKLTMDWAQALNMGIDKKILTKADLSAMIAELEELKGVIE